MLNAIAINVEIGTEGEQRFVAGQERRAGLRLGSVDFLKQRERVESGEQQKRKQAAEAEQENEAEFAAGAGIPHIL